MMIVTAIGGCNLIFRRDLLFCHVKSKNLEDILTSFLSAFGIQNR